MTQLFRVDPFRPDPGLIRKAADCLREGGLVAFPTETVYGLGVHALDPDAVRRLFAAKGRPANDPVIVHVVGLDQAAALTTELPDVARALAARFWPGPLTMVLRRHPSVPLAVTAGRDTVAIRVPAHPVAHALISAAGLPVAAPSANLFSRTSPTTAAHVLQDLEGRIDMILDGGATTVGVESTVVDVTTVPPRLLRPGGTSIEDLRTVVPDLDVRPTSTAADEGLPSPGLLKRHYAPRTPMTLFTGSRAAVAHAVVSRIRDAAGAARRVGVLATREQAAGLEGLPAVIVELGAEDDAAAVARRLYAALRELDGSHLDEILAYDVPRADGLWRAVHDRLVRAAAHTVALD